MVGLGRLPFSYLCNCMAMCNVISGLVTKNCIEINCLFLQRVSYFYIYSVCQCVNVSVSVVSVTLTLSTPPPPTSVIIFNSHTYS